LDSVAYWIIEHYIVQLSTEIDDLVVYFKMR